MNKCTSTETRKLTTYHKPKSVVPALMLFLAIVLMVSVAASLAYRAGRSEADARAEEANQRTQTAIESARKAQGLSEKLESEAQSWQQKALDASAAIQDLTIELEDQRGINEQLKRQLDRATTPPIRQVGWNRSRVSWYGPRFYGHTMAGGGRLQTTSMVVAHRSMRFGTKVQFRYKGRVCEAEVRDRGPFVKGREFDLGPGTAHALGFSGVGTVEWRVI